MAVVVTPISWAKVRLVLNVELRCTTRAAYPLVAIEVLDYKGLASTGMNVNRALCINQYRYASNGSSIQRRIMPKRQVLTLNLQDFQY